MIVSGAAVGAGTGAVCVAYDLEGTGLLVVATLWIACGVSWERAIGGKGILGGGIGGIIGGLAMAVVHSIGTTRRDELQWKARTTSAQGYMPPRQRIRICHSDSLAALQRQVGRLRDFTIHALVISTT